MHDYYYYTRLSEMVLDSRCDAYVTMLALPCYLYIYCSGIISKHKCIHLYRLSIQLIRLISLTLTQAWSKRAQIIILRYMFMANSVGSDMRLQCHIQVQRFIFFFEEIRLFRPASLFCSLIILL